MGPKKDKKPKPELPKEDPKLTVTSKKSEEELKPKHKATLPDEDENLIDTMLGDLLG